MRWLFVAGVSLDLAGALLIAMAVLSRTPAENREEALTKFGGNLWVIIMREREQTQVRAGVTLLGAGFILQLTGYLRLFRGLSILEGIGLAIGVLTIAFVGGRQWSRSRAPLSYHSNLTQPLTIDDERHAANLADLKEVET